MRSSLSELPDSPSLGVLTAGAIKLSYSGPVIDPMGWNNKAMGHGDGDRMGSVSGYDSRSFLESLDGQGLAIQVFEWPSNASDLSLSCPPA
jgi:hypothetical protein